MNIRDFKDDFSSQFSRLEISEEQPDILWIIASHVNIPAGKFAQTGIFSKIEGSKLYLNCENNSWYQNGINKDLDSIDKLVSRLQKLCEVVPSVRVVGHSMGAYLSLILQQCADVEFSISTSPEPRLMLPFHRSSVNEVPAHRGWDNLVERYMTGTSAPGVTLYGAYDPVDAYFIARFERDLTLYRNLYVVPYHHGVTEYLTQLKVYSNFLRDPFSYSKKLYNNKVLQFASDYGSKHAFLHFYNLYEKFHRRIPNGELIEMADERKSWKNRGYQYLRSQIYIRSERLEAAAEIAKYAIDAKGPYAEPAYSYARILAKIGSRQDMEALAGRLETLPYGTGAKNKILAVMDMKPVDS